MNRAGKDEPSSPRSPFPWTEAHELARVARSLAQTKVLLCGDHSLYRAALRILVETRDDFRIVAESTCQATPLEYALRGEIDLILMDHELQASSRQQLAGLERLLDRFAPRPVVIVTSAIDPQTCFAALRHGASAIVLKARGEETLLDAMTSAARGQVLLERAVLTAILSQAAQTPNVPHIEQLKIDQLTPREREIAGIACTGITNKQIAEKLSISEATVRHHLGVIFSKLGVSTRSELAAYGYRHNLVSTAARASTDEESAADTARN
ncbi:MAG TPA: response regulator transcription factor [Thermoanaerobaculia bacterium]|nr:response regulator transcription factor [Thermoanaerobaculia bacterium]